MPTLLGDESHDQPLTWRIDRQGSTMTKTVWGIRSKLELIAMAEKQFAESIEFKGGHGKSELTLTYARSPISGDAEVPEETQELDTEAVQQSLFLNKTFQPLIAEEQMAVRQAFDQQKTRAEAITHFGEHVDAGRQALALRAWDLMVMGTENFENYSFVLTRQRVCSRRWPGTVDLNSINKLWTTATLADYVQNPLLFAVPSLTLTADQTAKSLVGKWRQKVCRVSDSANGNRVINEVWQLAAWASDLYDAYP